MKSPKNRYRYVTIIGSGPNLHPASDVHAIADYRTFVSRPLKVRKRNGKPPIRAAI
jgi:hypothetical protein